MARNEWVQTPDDQTLGQRSGWRQLPESKQMFGAARAHILIVKNTSAEFKDGPIITPIQVPADAEVTVSEKQISTRKYSKTFTAGITETISQKVSYEVATSFGQELTGGLNPGVKAASKVDTKLAGELSQALQSQFTSTRSYEVTDTEEIVRSHTIKPGTAGATALRSYVVYLKLKVHRWDIYVYRIETARVKYRKGFFSIGKLRQNTSSGAVDVMLPVGQLFFYEPLPVASIADGGYVPAVADAELVEVLDVVTPAPVGLTPKATALATLVKTAFPLSKAEKQASKKLAEAIKRVKDEFAWIVGRSEKKAGGRKGGKARGFSRQKAVRKASRRISASVKKAARANARRLRKARAHGSSRKAMARATKATGGKKRGPR